MSGKITAHPLNQWAVILVLFVLWISPSAGEPSSVSDVSGPFVLGYYPAWVKETCPADAVDCTILTHIIHAFAWPEADGSISLWEGFLYPDIVEKCHQAGRKILVAFGGWGNCKGFPPMSANPEIRASFIGNVMEFCDRHGYDGIDIDWEFPANPVECDNLTRLVTELRTEADRLGKPFLITMAVSAGTWSGDHNDYSALKSKVDWFNDMTYDFYGTWTERSGHNAPLYGAQESVDTSIRFLTAKMGIPPKKILLGLPFYGRQFKTSMMFGPKTGGEGINYRDIAARLDEGWTRRWDDVCMVPYLVSPARDSMIFYDDPESIAIKCAYSRDKNLRGVMIWSIGSDFINGRQPLLETIGKTFR